jgi:hypothetical protein
MKSLIFTTVALLSTFGLSGQALAASPGQPDPEAQFKFFYHQGQAKVFQGRAQGLSMFNLDLRMFVHYKEPIGSQTDYRFNLASDGNQHLVGVPVWPVSGKVAYELTDENGRLKPFRLDGETVTFGKAPLVMYLVESDQAYQDRIERVRIMSQKDSRYEQIRGRLIGVVNFDIQKQSIRFFQVDDSGNMNESGAFSGSVTVPKPSTH